MNPEEERLNELLEKVSACCHDWDNQDVVRVCGCVTALAIIFGSPKEKRHARLEDEVTRMVSIINQSITDEKGPWHDSPFRD
jgi:hypothetical protein